MMEETQLHSDALIDGGGSNSNSPGGPVSRSPRETARIVQYLLQRVPEYRRLAELRRKGWNNPAGDRHFQRQRKHADNADDKTEGFFYRMMQRIGNEMQRATGAFTILDTGFWQPNVLDMCMAPGGFVATALDVNPGVHVTAFSLPLADGGHKVLLPLPQPNVTLKSLDVTMLAADMGVADIPADHPEAGNFLRDTQFAAPTQMFDLVICDGQVLRTHVRPAHREAREASRLAVSQLALGLARVRPGGTMIVLLHRVEEWNTVSLLCRFERFAEVRLFKPRSGHAMRGSFYMVATQVRSRTPEAVLAVETWKREWRAATFGTDEEYRRVLKEGGLDVEEVLKEFGPKLESMGRNVMKTQADALAKAPFVRGG